MQYLRSLILLFVVLIYYACADIHEYRVDDEFLPYIDRFEHEAQKHGRQINFENTGLIVEFADLKDNQAGLCYAEKPIRIEIDRAYWAAIATTQGADLMRENLLFHELGHGVLGREHLNSTLSNGDWKSMMCGGDKVDNRPWNINYRGVRRDYYVVELFNVSSPEPDFSSSKLPVDTSGFSTKLLLNFDTDKKSDRGWDVVDNQGYAISFENKKLKFNSKISSSFVMIAGANVDVLSDFSFEAKIKCQTVTKTDQFGIVFGSNNNESVDVEYLNVNNDRKMYTGNRNCYSFYTQLSKNEIRENAENKLKIVKKGSMQYYFINDVYVYCTETSVTSQGDKFGFMVSGNGVLWLDDFKISVKTNQLSRINMVESGKISFSVVRLNAENEVYDQ